MGLEASPMGVAHGVGLHCPQPHPTFGPNTAPQIDSIYVRNIFLMFGSVKTNFSISKAW